MENSNRCVFSLSGVSGMLIATVLLLSILAGLTILGLQAQQNVMQKPYKLENAEQIKMFDSKRNEHIIIKE
ncbi:DUF4006 family protein [Campylobacter armoricus]|uniref:DUF4006 domain-containing protein n=1 Tax=Campylobacter armoricus TaxID=2505970 RepID=A0A7L5INC4_9BACT|nr:DUF4006 family protein [Campylobacter armoricus]QKF79309.1 DUF4006 domain-containing protein [Campylobacter armoricus]